MKALFGLLVVVALGYAAYSGILAVGTYLEVSQIIDDAVLDLKPGLLDNVRQALGTDRLATTAKLRDAILAKATRAQLPITAEDIDVDESEQRMQIHVKWTQPVITYQNDVVFAVPLSVKRSFGPEHTGR